MESSIDTSDIFVNKTNHLQQRQRERDIETRELKAAVKHGGKVFLGGGNRVMHNHKDVTYITDEMGQVGITAYSNKDKRWINGK